MFIMMGLLLERTGLARDAFRVSERLLRQLAALPADGPDLLLEALGHRVERPAELDQ